MYRIFLLLLTLATSFQTLSSQSFNLTQKDILKVRKMSNWLDVDKFLNARGWLSTSPDKLKDIHVSNLTWNYIDGYSLTIDKNWKKLNDLSISADDKKINSILTSINGYTLKATTKRKKFYKRGSGLMLCHKTDTLTHLLFSTKDEGYWKMLSTTGKDPDVRQLDSYQVGDFIENEGGILFYVSDDYSFGYILAMTDANKGNGCEWGAEDEDIETEFPMTSKEWHEVNFDMDGRKNTDGILDYLDKKNGKVKYAAEFASEYTYNGKKDWYLPSEGQLRVLKEVIEKINLRLRQNGGVSLAKTWYWSSTEYDKTFAWAVNFRDNIVGRSAKKGNDRVRAVRTVVIGDD